MTLFRNIRADLATYSGVWSSQGFWVMIVYRFGRWRYTLTNSFIRKPFSLLYRFLYKSVQVLTGVELPCEVPVGSNFRIDHFGDIIISGYARFGDNCIIRNGVTVRKKRHLVLATMSISELVQKFSGISLLAIMSISVPML